MSRGNAVTSLSLTLLGLTCLAGVGLGFLNLQTSQAEKQSFYRLFPDKNDSEKDFLWDGYRKGKVLIILDNGKTLTKEKRT